MSSEESTTADTMRERAGTSRWKFRIFVETDRLVVVAALLSVVFVSLVVVGALVPDSEALLAAGDPVETAFQALIGATVTGVTLVLTLNQLVLSQELGAVGDQRERMEGAMTFREDVEDLLSSSIAPPEPAAFLRAMIDVSRERAEALREAGEGGDEDLRERVETLCDDVEDNAEAVTTQLRDAQFGTFDVVSAALNFNYSWKIYTTRRIRAEHGEALDDDVTQALEELLAVLELFGPAREHFKTLYIQWELVELSRSILAASIPSLVVATGMVFYYDTAALSGSVLGVSVPVVVVSGAVAVTLLPFAILLAYVVRIATVAKRTLSIGSFMLRRTSERQAIDWEE